MTRATSDVPPHAPSSDRHAAVSRVLELARTQLGMDVAWLSQLSGTEVTFTDVVAGTSSLGPVPGSSAPLEAVYCSRVLDGRLPPVVPDTRRDPVARDLPATVDGGIGAYAGVPVRQPDGTVSGMLCCVSASARPDLGARDRAVLELLAGVLTELQDRPSEDLSELRETVEAAVAGQDRTVVLQPIVDVASGRAVGGEALSRFSAEPFRPDLWFAQAERVGLRAALELAAAADALRTLASPGATEYVSINLSPATVTTVECSALLAAHDRSRIVVEITEHAAVADYDELHAALTPHRAAGLRVAVDDAGAGYASLRHIVRLRPDLIKVDVSLVRGIDTDPVKQALTSSLVVFAGATGGKLVAEGVETQQEYDTVAALGVELVQGYLLARPGERSPAGRYPRPSPGALPDETASVAQDTAALSARLGPGRRGDSAALQQERSREAVGRSRLVLGLTG